MGWYKSHCQEMAFPSKESGCDKTYLIRATVLSLFTHFSSFIKIQQRRSITVQIPRQHSDQSAVTFHQRTFFYDVSMIDPETNGPIFNEDKLTNYLKLIKCMQIFSYRSSSIFFLLTTKYSLSFRIYNVRCMLFWKLEIVQFLKGCPYRLTTNERGGQLTIYERIMGKCLQLNAVSVY